jgi:hypothetical protein
MISGPHAKPEPAAGIKIPLFKSKNKLCRPELIVFLARGSRFPAVIARIMAVRKSPYQLFITVQKKLNIMKFQISSI